MKIQTYTIGLAGRTYRTEKCILINDPCSNDCDELEAIQKDLLPNLSSLFSARDRITAILDREKSATKALKQAKEDLVDINKSLLDIDENIAMANDDLASANQDVKDKEEALARAKEKAKEVTDEERLAILRQAEAVQRLTDEQDGSEIKTLELT